MKIVALVMLIIALATGDLFAAEELQYRHFKFEDVSCDVGVLYRKTPDGMVIGVSAIPFGQGAEFRKWRITDIRLSVGNRKIKPLTTSKFFVKKENFWKYPSAVLFVVIGAQIPASGSTLNKALTRTGAAIGLGLLALAAEGDMTGERCTFDLDSACADRIIEGVDAIEITVEHPDLHRKYMMKIGLMRSPAAAATCDECGRMGQSDLKKLVDDLEGQVKELQARQSAYVSGRDLAFDTFQRDIDFLETKRGIAYKIWLDRGGEA